MIVFDIKAISKCVEGLVVHVVALRIGLMQYLFDVVEIVLVSLPSLSVGHARRRMDHDVKAYAFEIYTTLVRGTSSKSRTTPSQG